MKYQVGDLVLIKDIRLRRRPRRRPRLAPHPHLNNTHGIITEAIKHNDAWEGESKEFDNVYIWYSQVGGNEYSFFEDEVECEILK